MVRRITEESLFRVLGNLLSLGLVVSLVGSGCSGGNDDSTGSGGEGSGGAPASPTQCPGSTEACGTVCVDTATDPAHCGGCDVSCGPSEFCLSGVCSADCGDLTACGASCVDTQTSTLHCGECGTACGAGEQCQSGACACVTGSVSFSGEVQPVFSASCSAAGCHSGRRPASGLDLSAGVAYGNLVNAASVECGGGRTRVTPGEPANSYLMNKLTGIDVCEGTPMPKGVPLPQSQIDAIASWICSGAADN